MNYARKRSIIRRSNQIRLNRLDKCISLQKYWNGQKRLRQLSYIDHILWRIFIIYFLPVYKLFWWLSLPGDDIFPLYIYIYIHILPHSHFPTSILHARYREKNYSQIIIETTYFCKIPWSMRQGIWNVAFNICA